MSIKIVFNNCDVDNNRRMYEFEDSITIQYMIQRYLSECGLSETKKEVEYHDKDGLVKKLEVTPNYIFMYNGRILNKKDQTTLKNFFKNKTNVQIQVRDSSGILGGNNSMIDHKRKI